MPDSSGVPTRRGAVVLANARAHKCASTDRRYALMQTPALLRMPQERTTGATRRVVRSFKLRNSTSSTRSHPPTLSVANSRYSLSLSLSLLDSSIISFLLRLHLPSRSFSNASYFFPLTYCILISFFSLSPSGWLFILALPNGYALRDYFPATAALSFTLLRQPCFVLAIEAPHPHGCLLATSKHQPHVNFIVTVRVPNQRELTCNYRLATTLFLH